jgi:ATP/ADP translocase
VLTALYLCLESGICYVFFSWKADVTTRHSNTCSRQTGIGIQLYKTNICIFNSKLSCKRVRLVMTKNVGHFAQKQPPCKQGISSVVLDEYPTSSTYTGTLVLVQAPYHIYVNLLHSQAAEQVGVTFSRSTDTPLQNDAIFGNTGAAERFHQQEGLACIWRLQRGEAF